MQLLASQQVVHEVASQAKALSTALADVWFFPKVLATHMAVHPLLRGKHLLAAIVGAGNRVLCDVRLVAVDAMAAKTGRCGEVQAADVTHMLLWFSLTVCSRLWVSGGLLGVFHSFHCGVTIAVMVCGSFNIAVVT